jgi:two-component system, OmpR family, response regulator
VHILLVGRYKPLLKALRQGLEEEGCAVDVAADEMPAGDGSPPAGYDAILLDVTHLRDAGVSLVRAWRQAGMTTPVLALTGPGGAGEESGALKTAADDWLPKPFLLDDLLARLRGLARRGAAASALPLLKDSSKPVTSPPPARGRAARRTITTDCGRSEAVG